MTDTELLVLLATRLSGRAHTEAVATTFRRLGGAPAVDVGATLDETDARGLTRCRGAERRRSLTAAGTAALDAALARDTDAAGRAPLTEHYEAFLPPNRAFLAALAATVPPEERAALVPELVDRLTPVLDALTEIRPRFGGYAARFARAVARADEDPRWIEAPGIDSIHTIWFELHEHLLATLGRDRGAES